MFYLISTADREVITEILKTKRNLLTADASGNGSQEKIIKN